VLHLWRIIALASIDGIRKPAKLKQYSTLCSRNVLGIISFGLTPIAVVGNADFSILMAVLVAVQVHNLGMS